MATFLERLAFLQKVPTLMKATADDENPCPGYLFQEIGKISHESPSCGQCLLEYLLERLQVESCHVKLKVLKIFVHLCGHGSDSFLTELRRNSTFIQQASVYSGPPDPVHGTALYQKVRNTAQEVARLLFTDSLSVKSTPSHGANLPKLGMGSAPSHMSSLQGFGYSPMKQGTAVSDSLLDKIQKAAEVVASAVLPPTEQQGIRLHDNHYRAVVVPSAPIEVAVPACSYSLPTGKPRVIKRCPGQVGGGWEETNSSDGSSRNSSHDIAANGCTSVGSKSRSQSGASRGSNGDISERVEALQLGDCGQEVALISRLTEGSRVFLTREESQIFIKKCSTLNCEVVLELLSGKLQDASDTVKMRALCALSCLMTSDLLSLEQMFGATRRRLGPLSEGPPGPVANKATKILRQFEALIGGSAPVTKRDLVTGAHPASILCEDLPAAAEPTDTNTHLHLFQSHDPGSSTTAAEELLYRGSPGERTNEEVEEEQEEKLTHQNATPGQTQPVRTPGTTPPPEHLDSRGANSPPASPKPDAKTTAVTLSLFSGMEMVTPVKPPGENTAFHLQSDSVESTASYSGHSGHSAPSAAEEGSVSAFSFLNS